MRAILRIVTIALLAAAPATAFSAASAQTMKGMEQKQPMMAMGKVENAPVIPPVTGYSEGERILFLHTEASDPGIAGILTEMMGSPVLVVPALADAPESLRARVYVFENGLRPEGARGPLGYQPDVFDHPPGSEGYRPLREIVLVRWADPEKARLLRSAADIRRAIAAGEVSAEPTGIVVNMPLLTWPGGRR